MWVSFITLYFCCKVLIFKPRHDKVWKPFNEKSSESVLVTCSRQSRVVGILWVPWCPGSLFHGYLVISKLHILPPSKL